METDQRLINSKLLQHDDQFQKVNHYCDENLKSIVKISEITDKIRNSQELLTEKMDKAEKQIVKINIDLLKFNEVEKNIKENFTQIEESNRNLNDFQYHTNKKFSELDSILLSLIHSVSEIKKTDSKDKALNAPNSHLSALGADAAQSASPAVFEQMAKVNKDIENLKKLNREFSEKLERHVRDLTHNEALICDLTSKFEETQGKGGKLDLGFEKLEKLNESLNQKVSEIEKKLKEKEIAEQEEGNIKATLTEQLVKIHENLKNLTTGLNLKASKDETDKILKIIQHEVDKLNGKINEQNKSFEAKLKNTLQMNSTMLTSLNLNSHSSKQGQNSSGESDENAKELFKDFISKELPQKIKEQISVENEFLKDLLSLANKNKANISALNLSINELKTNFNEDFILNLIKAQTANLINKISELDEELKRIGIISHEKFKEIEGLGVTIEEELYNFNDFGLGAEAPKPGSHAKTESLSKIESSNSLTNSLSMKEILRLSLIYLKKNFEKVEKVNLRQDNMNTEILNKVKKDLNHESGKILDDFRNDLKLSISKIEEQLREKVDRFSLDEFGRRVDTKLNTEINKKIDRSDLKKNNNIINKKIDTLENKISKTLVDTLIDLQMDEMPLIIKKSMNGEKCASCNQFTQDPKNAAGSYQPNHTTHDEEMKHFSTQTKFKLRSIQDSSNKFGTGSYSRFLNNVDNVNEELYNPHALKTSKNFYNYLPDISGTTKNSNRKNVLLVNNTYSSVSSNGNVNHNNNNPTGSLNVVNNTQNQKIRIDDLAEKQFNSLINEEFEKKILNPENLIKGVNKVYDNIEKRNAANSIK